MRGWIHSIVRSQWGFLDLGGTLMVGPESSFLAIGAFGVLMLVIFKIGDGKNLPVALFQNPPLAAE